MKTLLPEMVLIDDRGLIMQEATECVPRGECLPFRFHVLSLKTGNPKQYGEWTGSGWIIDGKSYTPAEATQAGYRYAGINHAQREKLPSNK